MPVPDYGALPLAKFFLLCRMLSLTAMVCIVGLTANFVSEIVSTNLAPPREVVAALTIVSHMFHAFLGLSTDTCSKTCLAALYNLISIPFFYARANMGLLIMTLVDSFLLLSFAIISIVFGKPLSFLNCAVVTSASASGNAESSAAWLQSIASNIGKDGSALGLSSLSLIHI